MYIEKRNEYNDDFRSNSKWLDFCCFRDLNYLEDIKKDLDIIEKLIDVDFKNLKDKEFIQLISNFFRVYISKQDILKAITKVNGIEYDKVQKLNSRMTFKYLVSEGHGRDFSWWEETYQIGYLVATSKDLILNPESNYSKKEIKNMSKDKKIISFGKYIEVEELNCEPEEFENIKIPTININSEDISELACDYDPDFDFNLFSTDNTKFGKEMNKTLVSLIRKNLNKKKVLKECRNILLFLNKNMNFIDHVIDEESTYDTIDKNKYLNLGNEIKEKQKSLLLNLNEKR